MPTVKQVELPNIGIVKLYKRRGARAIKLTLHPDNYVRVSLPLWAPYRAGIEFVKAKQEWIAANRRVSPLLVDGQLIGKRHRLVFTEAAVDKPQTRVTNRQIMVKIPQGANESAKHIQTAARTAALKALKKEADEFLPVRLKQLARQHGFAYRSAKTKRLTARWGSCSNHQDIVLNIFLVTLPWDLIDYVILHELIHTRYQNHSERFWYEFSRYIKEPKQKRQELKQYQPHF